MKQDITRIQETQRREHEEKMEVQRKCKELKAQNDKLACTLDIRTGAHIAQQIISINSSKGVRRPNTMHTPIQLNPNELHEQGPLPVLT